MLQRAPLQSVIRLPSRTSSRRRPDLRVQQSIEVAGEKRSTEVFGGQLDGLQDEELAEFAEFEEPQSPQTEASPPLPSLSPRSALPPPLPLLWSFTVLHPDGWKPRLRCAVHSARSLSPSSSSPGSD